ncbi:2156_t:CDS:1, partial [Gigaspora rosea]
TFTRALTTIDLKETPLENRIQQLQIAAATNRSILVKRPVFPQPESSTLLAWSIQTIHDLGITIQQTGKTWPIVEKIDATSINTILIDHKRASILKKNCNKAGLKWFEQMLDYNVEKTLRWEEFHNNIQKMPRGIEPKWYREISELLASYENPTLKLKKPNPFTFNKVDKEVNLKWILMKNEIWGKVSSIKGYQMIVVHWRRIENNLERCKGCEKNNRLLKKKKCTMEVNIQDAYVVQVDTKHKIHMRIEDIIENERIATTNSHQSKT